MKRATIFLLAALAGGHDLSAKPAMNLIAIVTDDQAAWTVGCYGGNEIRTPNLDRLAAGGVRFANAFVRTPVCSPSRAAYLTGLYGTQVGFTDWLNDGQAKVQGLTSKTPTWPAVLAARGYATGLIGKWHLGSAAESRPWRNGLSEFTGNLGGGWAPNKVRFINEKGDPLDLPGFSVEICTDLAMKYVDSHRGKPFVLLVHYREPHAPYVPMPEQDVTASRTADVKTPDYPRLKQPYTANARRDYYASIAAVDRNVGRLLDHLEKTGLAERTIVTFTSDHGYNIGEHGIQHKGNGCWITEDRFRDPRPNMFDTSIRVPLLIRYPGVGKPGAVVREWVANSDMFATVLGLLGVAKPAAMPVLSRDFSAAVRGEALPAGGFPEELFGQYDLVNNPTKRHMRMIRTDRWKLILHLNAAPQNELYDLAADPGERRNLFGRPGTEEAVADLKMRIRRHMAAINDPRLEELP
jgi:uncharacterized sulfatase